MVIQKKLKAFVFPTIFIIMVVSILTLSLIFTKNLSKPTFKDDTDFVYTTRSIFDNTLPVIKTDVIIIKPFQDESVKVSKYFYDYLGDKENQENSIIVYDNTYLQNSGVNFVSDKLFNVTSILDGTVTKTGEDNLLGKFVEVKHSNDIISIYQGLSEVNVEKDSQLKQGDLVGKSGKNNVTPKENNTLHFELLVKGSYVNPLDFFDKKVQDI